MESKSPSISSLLFVVSGPAGTGKTTLCDKLLETYPRHIRRAITATTRAPRLGERHKRDYYFFEKSEFEQMVKAGDFVEHASVHGNYYGTLRSEIEKNLAAGKDILLNIDVQGAAAYRTLNQQAGPIQGRVVTIFIQPPSMTELKRRMLGRGTADKAELKRRLETALAEIPHARAFDYTFVSKTRAEDFLRAQAIYLAEKCRVRASR